MASHAKNTNKKYTIISIILFVLILMLIIGICSYKASKTKASKEKLEYITSEEWNDETYPEGMAALFRSYSGELKAQNIGKSIYYVTMEVIPKYREDLKGKEEKEITKYFNKNKDSIEIDTGIDNVDDFKAFINEIETNCKADSIEFESYYIDQSSITQGDGQTEATLCIFYKSCSRIDLKIQISNTIKSRVTSIKYLAN